MEQCIEAMLEDEQRERRAGPRQPRPPRDPDAPTYVSHTNLHVLTLLGSQQVSGWRRIKTFCCLDCLRLRTYKHCSKDPCERVCLVNSTFKQ